MPKLKRPVRDAILVYALAMLLTLCSVAGQTPQAQPSAEEIVERMREADKERAASLAAYTASRRYQLVNEQLRKSAEIVARIQYAYPGTKTFEVVSEQGSGVIRKRVLRRLIKAEEDASRQDQRQLAHIDFTNYSVRVVGNETVSGYPCYVLELTAKSNSPYLVNGRVWISSADYAVVRIHGTLAKRPSFWVGAPEITQDYLKHREFWLPHQTISITNAPFFGRTGVSIRSSDYEVRRGPIAERAMASPEGRD